MPLQFANPTLPAANYKGGGSQGMFTDLASSYQANKRQRELDRAYNVINTGVDTDNRSFLQKAMDKASGNEPLPMTPDAALNTIKRYDPKTWSVIQNTQIKMEKQQKESTDAFGKDAYQAIQAMKGMTLEQRMEQAPTMLQGLGAKHPLFADKINSLDLDQDGIFSNEELAKGEGYLSSWAGEQKDKWETVEVDGKPILRNTITGEEKQSPREDKQSDSEFERLLESSGKSEAEKQSLRDARLNKIATEKPPTKRELEDLIDITGKTPAEAAIIREDRINTISKGDKPELSIPQQRSNTEISSARERITKLGIKNIDDLRIRTTKKLRGLDNPDYNPTLARDMKIATTPLYGEDPEWDHWGNFLSDDMPVETIQPTEEPGSLSDSDLMEMFPGK